MRRSPSPTRMLYTNDMHTGKKYYIDCNTGSSQEVDGSGLNVKTYHTRYTGVVGSDVRKARASTLGDRAMQPEIPKKTKIAEQLVPKMLEDQ